MRAFAILAADRRHVLGAAAVLAGGVCFSLAGLLVRLLEAADGWQVVFYRSVAFSLAILLLTAVRYGPRTGAAFVAIGWRGVAGACGLAIGLVCFVWALFYTSVANAVFVFGALPFISAVLAWLLLGERVLGATWIAMTAALTGLTIMVGGGILEGRALGNLIALVGICGYAALVVTLRGGRAVDMTPVSCLGAALAMIIAAALVDSFAISARDLVLCILMGTVQLAAGFVLFTFGARHVRAGEASLLSNFEIVLGPIWVWLVVSEVPSASTLLGGAIIIVAVMGQALMTVRHPAAA